jgi:hypothetical protein
MNFSLVISSLPNTATLTGIERSSKLLHQQKIAQKKRKKSYLLTFYAKLINSLVWELRPVQYFGSEVTIFIPMTVLPSLMVL